MKKVTFIMALAVGAGLASCTAQSPKANLKTDVDSLSYAIGMARTEGLTQYLMQQGVDTTQMAEFIKGFNEGAAKAGITDKSNVMTKEAATAYMRDGMEAIKEKALAVKYADNKAAGEKYLAENKGKEGVVTTPSGLQYKIITKGTGAIPADTSKVKVNYKGTLIDGTEFDSSYKRNEPATFRANQVIKGWTEALTMMPVGSKWELYIPQELGYGGRETGGQIKPFSTLIFEVELVGIEK